MDFHYLTKAFYQDNAGRSEMLLKEYRPYVICVVTVRGLTFGIPLRSKLGHRYGLITDKIKGTGLDYSKAVLIRDPSRYIDNQTTVNIDQCEFNFLKGKEYILEKQFSHYIDTYIKAFKRQDITRNATLCKFSTMQYYHRELGIDR